MREKSSFEYGTVERLARKARRLVDPVQRSQWTAGPIPVEDISKVELVPKEKLVPFFSDAIKKLQELKGDEIGDYLEFGVFNGNSMASLYQARKALGADSMRMFGFDSFDGLPPEVENEDGGVWKKGFYTCSFEEMEASLKKQGITPEEIHWTKGWYKDTLTEATKVTLDIQKPGIVFIDCDAYSSSKTVLDFIAPMITEPVIICLDDWKLNDLDVMGEGEYKSFNEFLKNNPHLKAQSMRSYNRKSRTFLVSPR
jgi:hypothetical protein